MADLHDTEKASASSHSGRMEGKVDEVYVATQSASENRATVPEFYDPSKESVWTRMGVNLESFKRAPGATGYVVSHRHLAMHRPLLTVLASVVACRSVERMPTRSRRTSTLCCA